MSATPPPPLARALGTAERSVRALLERQLGSAGLSFPEWTVLTVLDGGGPLPARRLVQAQLGGKVVPDAVAAEATVERLCSSGLLTAGAAAETAVAASDDTPDGPALAATAAGEAAYRPVRQAVDRITNELFRDLPPADVEATRRTLTEVTRRAEALLAQPPTPPE